jgi:hypothetical protein
MFYFVWQKTFRYKDMTLLIFFKNADHSWQLYTVTQDDYELKKANHVFGWWVGGGGGAGGEPACVGWPRIKISLLVWNFFQNHKIMEKSLFYEAETGFMENIAS